MKVLIGIATYNRADLLEKAISSAYQQDYPDLEIAVFDDGSTDHTQSLCEKYPQIHWYRVATRQGHVNARNFLMQKYDVDIYCSLDDDAWFLNGDEIRRGVELFISNSNAAAVAYDILTPKDPQICKVTEPVQTHMFIGCGHMLRLDLVRQYGGYIAGLGPYGSEEKDLSIRLLDLGYEIWHLPGVHVWHDTTQIARNLCSQHRSGVANDLCFVLRRCPSSFLCQRLLMKIMGHIYFAILHGLLQPAILGIFDFLRGARLQWVLRSPVQKTTFTKFYQLAQN